ncbi:MAG: alpha/beta hydrolase [Candidatus Liptonbacteria bacterium]|nr:alpha/beta hydrolase [Candidatus Liptonbacteria bacterium]
MIEKIQIPSSLGKKLVAAVHYPESQMDPPAGEASKLAILCPGYLDTKEYPHLIELAKTLAEKGYTSVRFDPTGTWESEGDIAEYTTSQFLKDIQSVLEYMLRERSYEHILLGGHSRGGMKRRLINLQLLNNPT